MATGIAAAGRALGRRLAGDVVLPGDGGFDEARRVWNARVDRRPALVVRPRAATDVAEAVRFARERDLPIAVRGGGHSPAGHGTVDGGLVVDLSRMTRLEVDPAGRTARAEPGLTWGAYTAGTQERGLATPGGDVAAVGVSGLALAGGMGWLMRRYGTTVDNVLAVELVTADGRLLTASAEEHPDLFWGVRGGGGNLGVATGFRFRTHPVSTVVGGAVVHAATAAELRAYAEAALAAPDELTTLTFLLRAPPLPFLPAEVHGTLVHLIVACYAGDPGRADRALRPLRSLAGQRPVADTTAAVPYQALYRLTDTASVRRPHAVRNAYLRALPDATIAALLDAAAHPTSPFGLVGLRELGGAVARVPAGATAFAHRDKEFYLTVDNAWPDGEDAAPHVAWTERLWARIAPATDGAYAGYLDDEGDERVRAAYPPATYARLAGVKRRYDPDNAFRLNANVPPAG